MTFIQEQNPTIKVSEDTKKKLEALKIIPQEPLDSVIRRLMNNVKIIKRR